MTLMWGAVGMAGEVSTAEPVTVNAWLLRMHEASRQRAYTGTFVVSAGAKTASAKIWHVCDGTQQMERVEPLSGPPRSTFRRNDQVITFFPESRVAIAESRESLGLFPNLLKSSDTNLGEFYGLKVIGSERVVGVEADVLQLIPKDSARYGYRVWSEKRTGLVVQLQTLDSGGRVIEQAAFSELHLDAPVSMAKLSQMMGATEGYRIENPSVQKTTPEAQGWSMRRLVPGFHSVGCYLRTVAVAAAESVAAPQALQWMFSDGLATVSLFVEPFDSRRHVREGAFDFGGATHTLTRHLDGWWVTAVGEVPTATLNIFSQALERRK
ncbi:MAG: MucB/RseB C-terminal domain-containing protein [Burkholderiales bacterium]|nr:MucB/RseB C-terminal domain-containing protein [Burkholderiales bacterium]